MNSIGLARRGFSAGTISQLKRAYRYLLQANTTQALAQIESLTSWAKGAQVKRTYLGYL